MSIKQSIAALLVLMSVSFSASADEDKYYRVNSTDNCKQGNIQAGTLEALGAKWAVEGCFSDIVKPCTFTHANVYRQKLYCDSTVSGYGTYQVEYQVIFATCPEGYVRDDQSGNCELPPATCEELKAKDAPAPTFIPDDGQAMTATRYYCDINRMCEAQQSYFASAGDLVKENYYTGNECVGSAEDYTNDPYYPPVTEPDSPDPEDPTHNPDDPTVGEIVDPSPLPDSSNNTVAPDETEPEAEVEDPLNDPNIDPTATDTAVVSSIKGLNSDVNKALNALNVDLNQSSADIQNQIIALKGSMVTNTQAIQKQQINDNKIYENTKALIQQANGDITTAVNRNTNSVGEVVKGLDDLQTTNADGFAELSDKLDDLKPCEPTEENNYCENPHGLGSDYVGDVLTQADKAVSGAMNSYEKTVTDAAKDLIEKNLTAESEGHINAISDSFLSVLPKPTPCMNLSLPTLGGGSASISCEFSQKLKMIISILIYIYTIKTLVEILLTEVTPVPSNKPGSGRYY
nr:chemotaxis protein [uncultured Vibrio sp.]